MHSYKLELGIFLALIFFLSAQPHIFADSTPPLSIFLGEELTLTPGEENQLLRSQTTLLFGTLISGVELESETVFGGDIETPGLNTQSINLGYTGEKYSANLNAVFNPQNEGLDYVLQEVELTGEDIKLSNRLLLEYVSEKKLYGSGFETKLSGSTDKGVSISATIRFGMDEYLREVYDPSVDGSGYYIITDGKAGPSQFPFGSALIEISNVGFGPCTIGNRTKFFRGEGFLFSGFNFDLIDKGPWKTRSFVFFNDKEKTVTLVPTIQFGEDRWEVVADFGGKLEGNNSTLDKLMIRGIKFNSKSLGKLKISGISALAGEMKKEKGADKLDLRADDYKLARSFDEIAQDYLFEKVEWSDVLTMEYDLTSEKNLKRYLAFDWYFKRNTTNDFFDLNTVNAVANWELNPTLSLGTGISLKTETGLERIVFDVAYDF